MLGLEQLEEKQLYRGLGRVTVKQYQEWMGEIIKGLQIDERTKSEVGGVVIGDTSQVVKKWAQKVPMVHVLYVHSEKVFAKGVEIVNSHYADEKKDYPLFMAFYEPSEEVKAERAAKKKEKKAGVDRRKPGTVLAYLKKEKEKGNKPELVTLVGSLMSEKFIAGIEEMGLRWVGISDKRRVYTLKGTKKKQKGKALLATPKVKSWLEDADLGYRFAVLGLASGSVGQVKLIVAEHIADQVRTLYVVSSSTTEAEGVARISLLLSHQQAKQETGILHLTLNLLKLGREANIQAENAAFDRWFFVPWFIQELLALGFKRVVIKAKRGFPYTHQGRDYDLDDLWALLSQDDFKLHFHNGQSYWLASLPVEIKGLGLVKLVFVRQPMRRRRQQLLNSVLMCTDSDYPDFKVLKIYLLRWRIEVCYREVKQNHFFGQFHSQNHQTNYGQTLLSLVAYLFETVFRLTVPALSTHTLGWIKDNYLNAIVFLVPTGDPHNPDYVLELPAWLLDNYGLPDWGAFDDPLDHPPISSHLLPEPLYSIFGSIFLLLSIPKTPCFFRLLLITPNY
jgi:hypothetical protein